MVLALYVVAGVMVAGGMLAIYSGSEIIVMERGWTMVIAGSVVAASGALLAGIATAVGRLQGLEGEFARLSDRLARQGALPLGSSPDMTAERASPDARAGAPLVGVPEIRGQRDLEITPEPGLRAPPMSEDTAAAVLPDERPASPRELATVTDRDELFADTEPTPEAAEAAPEPAPPTIVGTYNSGGNFYIMYSDGSIEAETPAGKFRFDSLDELKTFIAAGGDKAKATS